MKIKCHNCNKNPAETHSIYGIVWCKPCQANSQSYKSGPHIPDYIREQQKKHHDDFVQPHVMRNGKPVVNEEFVKLYPDKAHTYYTSEEIKRAGMPKLIDYSREVKYRESQEKQRIESYKSQVIEQGGDPGAAMRKLIGR